jgi:transmembrane sensor
VSYEINDIDELIGKVLAGEATGEEVSRLESWAQLSEDNRHYVEQLKLIFEKAGTNAVKIEFDADTAWLKVKQQLQKKENVNLEYSKPVLWPVLRIAAGIAVILFAGWMTYDWLNTPTQTFAMTSDVATVQDTLPDGSTAYLNRNSKLQYEYNPREKIRKVKLKGESFFEVKHEEEKPFVIEAEQVLVRDIGTSFNIKAYAQDDTVEVSVKSGEVQIYTIENSGLNLKAGQTGIYSKRNKAFHLIEKIDSNVLAYKTRVFVFNSTELKTVIEQINTVYNSRVKIGNPEIANCKLTVTFKDETLDTVVGIIAETLKLTVSRKDKEIILNGSGCNP